MSAEQTIIDQNPSIYIPYVYDTTTPQFVRDFLQDDKKYGRVDFISPKWVKEATRTYVMMRVYFRSWNASEEALAFKRQILDGEKVRVVWGEDKRSGKELYWMVQLNNASDEQKEADRKRYSEYLEKKRSFRTEKRRDERSPSPRRGRREERRDERRDGWQDARGRGRAQPSRRGRSPSRSVSPPRRERSVTPPPKCRSGVIHYMDTCRCRSVSRSPSRDERTPPRRRTPSRERTPPPAPRRERKVSRSPPRREDVAELKRQIERQAEMINKLTAMMAQMEMPNVTVRKPRKLTVPTMPKRWSDEEDDELVFEDDEDTDAAEKTKTETETK
jgi:hypothetical protein